MAVVVRIILALALMAAVGGAAVGGAAGGSAHRAAGDDHPRIVSIEVEPGIGSWSAWLDNGVRLHALRVAGRPGEVVVTMRLAFGAGFEDAATAGLTEAALFVLDDRLTQALGRNDTVLRSMHDAVEVRWQGAARLLDEQLAGIARALGGGFDADSEASRASVAAWRAMAVAREGPLEAVVSETLWRTVVDGAFAPHVPTDERSLARATARSVTAWAQRIARAPVEVAIAGDVAPERALAAGQAWLGTLEPRGRIGPHCLPTREPRLREGPWRREAVTIERERAQSMVVVGIVTDGLGDLDRARALLVGAGVAGARLDAMAAEVARTTDGGAPMWERVDALSWPVSTRLGVLALVAIGPGGAGEAIERDLRAVLDGLLEHGISAQEVAASAGGHLERLAARRDDPAFWADAVLAGATYQGREIARVLELEQAYGRVTAAVVQETLAEAARARGGVSVIVESVPRPPVVHER